jgi:hypothetical protein
MRGCPHCLSRVVAKGDGTCPSCGADMSKAPERSDRALVELQAGRDYPAVCIECGEACERSVKHSFVRTDGNLRLPLVVRVLMSVVMLLLTGFAFILRGRERARPKIVLQLPLCRACETKLGKVDPRHVNFQTGIVTAECHRAFRKANRKHAVAAG